MQGIHKHIWEKFGIKHNDTLPMTGAPWNMTTTRKTIAEIIAIMGFKRGAEIGVERGIHAQMLFATIPNLHLICVDPWKAYNHNSQEHEDHIYDRAMLKLTGCDAEILRMTSMEASKLVPDNTLDFVYIDALHYFDDVMMDIIMWSRKVHSGGIIAGHDYVDYYQYGVIQAVNAYIRTYGITLWYLTTGEKENSWFWVKS